MALHVPEPVDIRFVKASSNSITMDFLIQERSESNVVCYELQWKCESDKAWLSASRTLKSRRCTKSNLMPGTAYVFRVRACDSMEQWGPFGSPTPPIFTKLPGSREECSEPPKLPMTVALKCTGEPDEQEREVRWSQSMEQHSRDDDAARTLTQEEAELEEIEARSKTIIGEILTETTEMIAHELRIGADQADRECRERIATEAEKEETEAISQLLQARRT